MYRAPLAYPFRWPTGLDHCAMEALNALEDLVVKQIGAHNTAAIVIEPIQGEGGFIIPPAAYLQGVASLAREHGIVLIADEVQTGIARTEPMFASEHDGLVPDLIVTAKGLAGGLPLAGVTGRAEIMDAVPAGGLGGTFAGNPVACAAALGVFETIEEYRPRRPRPPDRGDYAARSGGSGTRQWVGRRGPRTRRDARRRVRRPRRHQRASPRGRCGRHGRVTARASSPSSAGTHGNVIRLLPPLVSARHPMRRSGSSHRIVEAVSI
ncbi:MAG: aminotransferase class III-fold pyridoxal phosphate-dependent enzyme [Dermatophilaceae bacterium]